MRVFGPAWGNSGRAGQEVSAGSWAGFACLAGSSGWGTLTGADLADTRKGFVL